VISIRIYFATDVHGSETCWRKFLNSAAHYGADVLVLGGDMTGKALVPVVDRGGGHWTVHLNDQVHDLHGEDEVAGHERLIRERGFYPLRLTQDELAECTADDLDARFEAAMRRTVEDWVAMADERLSPQGIPCVVCPGNDDAHDIDEVLAAASWVQVGEGRVIELPGGYELVSTGWSNRTPWKTHREEDEPDLRARIDTMVQRAGVAPERLVLNLHCPPHGTSLDVAPKISEDLYVQGQETAHVGSTAVRDVIHDTQPALSLHGHIHESRAAHRNGRTLAINPGSSYEQGLLQGCLVELNGKSKVKRYKLTAG
jgi:Icc-related predicted phosphoesterase